MPTANVYTSGQDIVTINSPLLFTILSCFRIIPKSFELQSKAEAYKKFEEKIQRNISP